MVKRTKSDILWPIRFVDQSELMSPNQKKVRSKLSSNQKMRKRNEEKNSQKNY